VKTSGFRGRFAPGTSSMTCGRLFLNSLLLAGMVLTTLPSRALWAASPEALDPLGYPSSIGDETAAPPPLETEGRDSPPPAVSRESERRRADEPQVPGGLDAWRFPPMAHDPGGLLTWFQEPQPASPCDRDLVDPAWMGPGELAFHRSRHRCRCGRDHTRAFRSEFLGRLWVDAEYLLWATSAVGLPALATASPAGTDPGDVGVLGAPDTRIAFGNGEADGPMRSGGRITAGYWWEPSQQRGIEAGWFGLTNATESTRLATEGGSPWLARPYRDATDGLQAAVVVPPPGTIPDDVSLLEQTIVARQTAAFSGVDVLYRHAIASERFHRRYLVGGWRFFMLEDKLTVSQEAVISTGSPGGLPTETLSASDSFRSLSLFNGAEFGLVERWWRGRTSLEVVGRVALGGSTISTTIDGGTVVSETTGEGTVVTDSFDGGLLALPTNIGYDKQSLFAAAGEFGIAADYALWSQCRLSLGYTLIWLTTVGRAADQVDSTINPSQLGGGSLDGPADPSFRLRTSDFWAQGVTIGLEYQF
jgi:hypothetical protein